MSQNGSQRIQFLHTLRGIAAVSVLFHHYFFIFFERRALAAHLSNTPLLSLQHYPAPTYIHLLDLAPYVDWGALGVGLFFLISGCVIPNSIIKLSYKNFLINRFLRIFPVYFLGFSCTLLAILIGDIYFSHIFPYKASQVFIHYFPGIRDLLHSVSIDGIIWTLEIELKFYVICVLSSFLFKKNSLKVFIIPIGLGILAFYCNQQIVPLQVKPQFFSKLLCHFFSVFVFNAKYIIFIFIGVLFNYYYRSLINIKIFFLLSILLLGLFHICADQGIYHVYSSLTPSYLIALSVFYISFVCNAYFKKNIFFNFLANISYPLYVIHGVLGFVMLRILLDLQVEVTVALMVTITSVTILAFLIHYYVERFFMSSFRNLIAANHFRIPSVYARDPGLS